MNRPLSLPRPSMKLRVGGVLLAVIPFMTAGCWDYHELDQDAIVSSFSYDLSKAGKAQITIGIEMNRGGQGGSGGGSSSGGQQNDVFAHGEGNTFLEAIRNASQYVPNRLNFNHHVGSIYAEKTASSPIFLDLLDRLTRNGITRRRNLMFLVSGRAQDTLQAKTTIPTEIGQALSRLAEETYDQQLSARVDLNDFLYDLAAVGIQPIVPRLVLAPTSQNGRANTQHNKVIKLLGCGAFRDGRFVGWLNAEETRGLLWLRGRTGHANLSLPQNGKIVVTTSGLDTKISVLQAKAGTASPPSFLIRLQWQGTLAQYNERKAPDGTIVRTLEQATAERITATLTKAITRAQQLRTDVVGFGNVLYRSNPALYRAYASQGWDATVFPHLRYQIEVLPTIMSTGMTSGATTVRS